MNPARQAALEAGLPPESLAMTINKVCGSGLKSMHLAYQSIVLGESKIVVAGGQENMSLAPHVLPKSREGKMMGHWQADDSMIKDGLWCAHNDYHMGVTAENIAAEYKINRADQDAFAIGSQQKASAAQEQGKFKDQIVPVPIKKGKATFEVDEYIKHDAKLEALEKLRPAFKKDGSVTAGNASGINDGAALVMIMAEETAKQQGLTPLAFIKSFGAAGVDPKIMGTGPIPAVDKALKKAGWTPGDLDLIEANEAFAVQALSVNQGVLARTGAFPSGSTTPSSASCSLASSPPCGRSTSARAGTSVLKTRTLASTSRPAAAALGVVRMLERAGTGLHRTARPRTGLGWKATRDCSG